MHNIGIFLDSFTRPQLYAWGAENRLVPTPFPDSPIWALPFWFYHGPYVEGALSYRGGLQNVTGVPYLGAVEIVAPPAYSEFLGANLGMYQKAGTYFFAIGFMPNPAFAPSMSGSERDPYIQFFRLHQDGRTSSYTILERVASGSYAYGNTDSTQKHYAVMTLKKIFLKAQGLVGHAAYVLAKNGIDFPLYRESTLGLRGKNGKLFNTLNQDPSVWFKSGTLSELPAKAPDAYIGELRGSTVLLPGLKS